MKIIGERYLSSENAHALFGKNNWSIYEPELNTVRGLAHRGADAIALYTSGDLAGTSRQVFDDKPHIGGIDVIAYEANPKFKGEGDINVYHSIVIPIANGRGDYVYRSVTYAQGARVPHYPKLEEVIKVYKEAFANDVEYSTLHFDKKTNLWIPRSEITGNQARASQFVFIGEGN